MKHSSAHRGQRWRFGPVCVLRVTGGRGFPYPALPLEASRRRYIICSQAGNSPACVLTAAQIRSYSAVSAKKSVLVIAVARQHVRPRGTSYRHRSGRPPVQAGAVHSTSCRHALMECGALPTKPDTKPPLPIASVYPIRYLINAEISVSWFNRRQSTTDSFPRRPENGRFQGL